MKVRIGFVSNSSSSSFVIFGKLIDDESFRQLFEFTDNEMNEIISNGMEDYENHIPEGMSYMRLPDQEWIVGSELNGYAEDLQSSIAFAEQHLGNKCKLYSGIDIDGVIIIDSCCR